LFNIQYLANWHAHYPEHSNYFIESKDENQDARSTETIGVPDPFCQFDSSAAAADLQSPDRSSQDGTDNSSSPTNLTTWKNNGLLQFSNKKLNIQKWFRTC
jgi:hypothetical protein